MKPNYREIVNKAIGEKPSLVKPEYISEGNTYYLVTTENTDGRLLSVWIEDKQSGLKMLVTETKPFNIPKKNDKQDTK